MADPLDAQFTAALTTDGISVSESIKTAMDAGKALIIDYDGESRLVEPHAIGISTKGSPCFRGYQVLGGSNSGEFEGWKMFTLEKVESAQMLDSSYVIRDGYKKGDKGMLHIIKEL